MKEIVVKSDIELMENNTRHYNVLVIMEAKSSQES